MLTEYSLDLGAAVDYARKWAYGRSPVYADFTHMGGDCTNFISQCIFAAGAVMNFTPDTGWYYISLNDRSAAWTGVEYFSKFILTNRGAGPFGILIPIEQAAVGDVIQLGNRTGYYHTLIIVSIKDGEIFTAAHTRDVFGAPLSSYNFTEVRCLRIRKARKYE